MMSLHEPVEEQPADASAHPLMYGAAPDWASGWGQDTYGVYVEFTVKDVTQRLRWVPMGAFLMGAPPREDATPAKEPDVPRPRTLLDRLLGRTSAQANAGPRPSAVPAEPSFDWEHPQHFVLIRQGYWLMDTPVTQGLYEAVAGENPSRFKSADRPVEQVSWEEAQAFILALNEQVAGLALRLPSEAEWEYACRAGTRTATYAGSMEIVGERNAPVLNDIAWYGGNSGVGFELADGHDSSGWKEKQFEHSTAGTRPVRLKKPNALGLYDMLGNVWEWCEDHWHGSYDGAPGDGRAWLDADADSAAFRVIRGGSWLDFARSVRSASRYRFVPQFRSVSLGFRCARGPDGLE
jgi:formylglycine-generating enzyme required for sulfatase activity